MNPTPEPVTEDSSRGRPIAERGKRLLGLIPRRTKNTGPVASNPRFSDISLEQRLNDVWKWPVRALVVGLVILSLPQLVIAVGMVSITSSVREISISAVSYLEAVGRERSLSMRYVTTGDPQLREALAEQRDATDQALQRATDSPTWIFEWAPPAQPVQDKLDGMLRASETLEQIRQNTNNRRPQDQIYQEYNSIVDAGAALFDTQARTFPDYLVAQGAVQATEWFATAETQSRASSLAATALITGKFDSTHYHEFVGLTEQYRHKATTPASIVAEEVLRTQREVTSTQHWNSLRRLETRFIDAGPTTSADAWGQIRSDEWNRLSEQVSTDLYRLVVAQADYASWAGYVQGWKNIGTYAGLLSVAGLIGVFARRKAKQSAGALKRRIVDHLRNDMRQVSNEVIPAHFRTLASGELPDEPAAILPREDYGTDEIATVKYSFDEVVRIALESSTERARDQAGMQAVLIGMAERSETLIAGGFQSIDQLLQDHDLPQNVLSLVLSLDQTLTRTRRHTENILIISGKQPGRLRTEPVALLDVLRGAGQETEDHTRVHYDYVPGPEDIAIVPDAVDDLIHLLAELIDNAIVFSNFKVTVQVAERSDGAIVRVEDEGFGLDDEFIQRTNDLFRGRVKFNLATLNSSKKGHYVVAQLANKHGILVELESLHLRGTRVKMWLPEALLVRRERVPDERADRPTNTIHAVPMSPMEISDGLGQRLSPRRPALRRSAQPSSPVSDISKQRDDMPTGRHHQPSLTSGSDVLPTRETAEGGRGSAEWGRLEGTLPPSGATSISAAQTNWTPAPEADAETNTTESTWNMPAEAEQRSTGKRPLPRRRRNSSIHPELLANSDQPAFPGPAPGETPQRSSPDEIRETGRLLMEAFDGGESS